MKSRDDQFVEIVSIGNLAKFNQWLADAPDGAPLLVGKSDCAALVSEHAPREAVVPFLSALFDVAPQEMEESNAYMVLSRRGLPEAIVALSKMGLASRGEEGAWFIHLAQPEVSREERRTVWDGLRDRPAVSRFLGNQLATMCIANQKEEFWGEWISLAQQCLSPEDVRSITSARMGNVFALILRDAESDLVALTDVLGKALEHGLADPIQVFASMGRFDGGASAAEMQAVLLSRDSPVLKKSPAHNRL